MQNIFSEDINTSGLSYNTKMCESKNTCDKCVSSKVICADVNADHKTLYHSRLQTNGTARGMS